VYPREHAPLAETIRKAGAVISEFPPGTRPLAPHFPLRNRIINDFENVANEYDLHGQQREAAKSMINVGSGGLVSDHVGPLAAAGAHPLQALMALHVIFSNNHKRGQAAMAGKH
jgi:hypothetical protein